MGNDANKKRAVKVVTFKYVSLDSHSFHNNSPCCHNFYVNNFMENKIQHRTVDMETWLYARQQLYTHKKKKVLLKTMVYLN